MTEQRVWLKASHRKCAVSVWRRQVVQVFVFKYITDRQSQKMNAILHTRIVQNKLHEQKLISRILLQWRGGGFIWWECASNFLKCFSACDSMWYKVAQQASSVCKFLQDFPHTSAPPRATVIFFMNLYLCPRPSACPGPSQLHTAWFSQCHTRSLHSQHCGATKGFIQLFPHMQQHSPRPVNTLWCVRSVELAFNDQRLSCGK